jgi:hypothetical protein
VSKTMRGPWRPPRVQISGRMLLTNRNAPGMTLVHTGPTCEGKMLRRMPWCHARRTRSSAESSFDSTISVHFSIPFSSFPSFHPTFRPCQMPLVAHRYVCARLPLFPSSVLVQKPRQEVSSSGFPISIELNWNLVD